MNNTTKYTCECGRSALSSLPNSLPAGWTVNKGIAACNEDGTLFKRREFPTCPVCREIELGYIRLVIGQTTL